MKQKHIRIILTHNFSKHHPSSPLPAPTYTFKRLEENLKNPKKNSKNF